MKGTGRNKGLAVSLVVVIGGFLIGRFLYHKTMKEIDSIEFSNLDAKNSN